MTRPNTPYLDLDDAYGRDYKKEWLDARDSKHERYSPMYCAKQGIIAGEMFFVAEREHVEPLVVPRWSGMGQCLFQKETFAIGTANHSMRVVKIKSEIKRKRWKLGNHILDRRGSRNVADVQSTL